ncbi:MAG: CsbD family protein [Terracidiphilus sp.]
MNNDKIKGTIDDAAGRAKRQVGEWTGDTQTQVDGAAQQVKGKAEKAVGNIRDAVNNAINRPVERDSHIDDNRDRESVRERE